jgi:uncharacterized membrane protein YgcG
MATVKGRPEGTVKVNSPLVSVVKAIVATMALLEVLINRILPEATLEVIPSILILIFLWITAGGGGGGGGGGRGGGGGGVTTPVRGTIPQ